MKIFVTGASGFIGLHFLDRAMAAGHQVVGLTRNSSPPVFSSNEGRQPVWVCKSIGEVRPTDLEGIDALVHLAAAGVSPRPALWEECFKVNVSETIRLVESALTSGIRRIVATGSFAEYGEAGLRYDKIPVNAPLEPSDAYASSKAAASVALRAMCRSRNFELVYLRLFSVFGPGQFKSNLWPSLHAAAVAGQDFPMTHGEQIRDFIDVATVADRLLNACERADIDKGKPNLANLGSGNPQRVREFCEYWWHAWGATGKLQIGALPYRENEVMRYVPEITEA
jgi:UDP-glucose 4-epimerase